MTDTINAVHVASGPVSSWPYGFGKGSFVQTVTCSCGAIYSADDTNDYYDLELGGHAMSKWKLHALPLNQVVLADELTNLPEGFPTIRLIAEDKLAEWTLRI